MKENSQEYIIDSNSFQLLFCHFVLDKFCCHGLCILKMGVLLRLNGCLSPKYQSGLYTVPIPGYMIKPQNVTDASSAASKGIELQHHRNAGGETVDYKVAAKVSCHWVSSAMALLRQVMKLSNDEYFLSSLGKLLPYCNTPLVRKYFQMSHMNLPSCSLKPSLLVL